MAFFNKKKKDEDGSAEVRQPQPEKARKWFEHAKAAALSSNYAYALQCYASGIKLDPDAMSAHEAMLQAAVRYARSGGKPASRSELKSIDDGSAEGKMAAAELDWMSDLTNPKAALKLLDACIKAGQVEIGHWVAPHVLTQLMNQKKLSKSAALDAKHLFQQVNAWDEAYKAIELAKRLDPNDSELDAELKNLSAQRAMDQGGYIEAAGKEGGFRTFVKDSDKQQELIEAESLAGGGSVEERNLARAKAQFEETPDQPDAINRYAQLLKKQGTPETSQQAHDIYMLGFEKTDEYRFRMYAGDIRIEQASHKLRDVKERLENGGDDALRVEHQALHEALLKLRLEEYTDRIARYPTDRNRKYELGQVQYELGDYDEAMAQFQAAKDEPKLRIRATQYLGRCFMKESWFGEAISEFEEALKSAGSMDSDREQSIRYDLMSALLAAAKEEESADLGRRAKVICSEIARKDITYRDIRAKRKEVDEVIKSFEA